MELSGAQMKAVLALKLQKAGLRPTAAEIKSREVLALQQDALLSGALTVDEVIAQVMRGASADLLSPSKRASQSSLSTSRSAASSASSAAPASSAAFLSASSSTSAAAPEAVLSLSLSSARSAKFVPPAHSPRKEPGIWKEMVALDSTLAEASKALAHKRATELAHSMRSVLDAQVAERAQAKREQKELTEREGQAQREREAAARRGEREAAVAKAAAAEAAARQIAEFTEAERERRAAEVARRNAEEMALVKAAHASLVSTEQAAAATKLREKEALKGFMQSNEVVLAERRRKAEALKAEETAAAKRAVAAMDAAEAKRLAEIAEREAALRKKLDAMGEHYAKVEADNRAQEARLEAERKRGEAARDAEEIARAQRRKAFEGEIKKEVALQLEEKARVVAANKQEQLAARRVAEAGAAQVLRSIEEEKRAREAKAHAYSSELDVLVRQKLAAASLADETPLERKLVATFMSEVKGALKQGKVPLTL